MTAIRQALQAALDENDGRIPFDMFMAIALHHPDDGYYARNIRGIGSRGDFTTAPQLTPALGRAVAGWLREQALARGWKNFDVIECGPGDGSLAAAVLDHFGWLERRRVTLHLVETSAPLRQLQKTKLRGRRAHWHHDITSALQACNGHAIIYHNEFFDAFPCRVFRKEHDRWAELHLRVRDGRLTEEWLERPLPPSSVFAKSWTKGQRVEVFSAVNSWLHELARNWQGGAMLAIDYGGAADSIYHRRPAGTLRAYRGQQRFSGEAVYEMPGRQDITADVNFGDLQLWAQEAGCRAETAKPLTDLAPDAPGADAFRCAIFSR
jgi:SAM-dependent MidA family methyltransferase